MGGLVTADQKAMSLPRVLGPGCCKVAVDACFLSSRIYCAGSGRVSRPRRSADRRFPGDAPTVGDSFGEGLLDPPFG